MERYQSLPSYFNYHGSDLSELQRLKRKGGIRNVTCRQAIADYGKFMGRVDRANQYASYYEVQKMVESNFLLSFGDDSSEQLHMLQ